MARLHSLFPLLLLAGFQAAHAESSGALQVTVENVPDGKGTIRVAVCTRKEFLGEDCRLHALVPAARGESRVTVPHVPPGVYAVQAYQDWDGNGRLDRNFFGIPREPIGFSRDPALHFGPPSFAQCAVSVGTGGGVLRLRLRTK